MYKYTNYNTVVRALHYAQIHNNLLKNMDLCAILIQSTYTIENLGSVLICTETKCRVNIILPSFLHQRFLMRTGGRYAEYYEL